MEQKELRDLENLCIQEQPPHCSAVCPLSVDVRGMLAAVSSGDFDFAARIYKKAVPFPSILARICDQPCMNLS